MNIQEDYCDFETAKLMKEKGFPLPSINYENWICCMYDKDGKIHWGCYHPEWYARVTLQMACKWLREVHKIFITIIPQEVYIGVDRMCYAIYRITENSYQPLYNGKVDNPIDSYENTCGEAVKYSLENLI